MKPSLLSRPYRLMFWLAFVFLLANLVLWAHYRSWLMGVMLSVPMLVTLVLQRFQLENVAGELRALRAQL